MRCLSTCRHTAASSTDAVPDIPKMLAWGLGVAMLVHVTSFMAVSYFGQIIMVWYMTLAIIGGLTLHPIAAGKRVPVGQQVATPRLAHLAAGAL